MCSHSSFLFRKLIPINVSDTMTLPSESVSWFKDSTEMSMTEFCVITRIISVRKRL